MNKQVNEDVFHPTIHYNRKLYKTWFMRKLVALSGRILDIYDGARDRKICGCSLVKYVPSLYRETKGATGSQATRYCILDEIFSDAVFCEQDNFMDIGCGKARVIAYLLGRRFPGKLNGIELNHDVAEYAKSWTEKYENVSIIEGDAFEQNFDSYNLFFLGRPFETEFFQKFIEKFEQELTHPVTVYYWVDQQSGNFLDNREGWTIHKRKWIFKKHGFYTMFCPQRYSIWTYTPKKDVSCR